MKHIKEEQKVGTENKHDLSVSALRANIVAFFIMVPVAILQFAIFYVLHGSKQLETTFYLLNVLLFLVLVSASIVVHELLHGLTWMAFGKKSFSSIKFGVQWKTLTPYAHLKVPIEVNVYRMGGFMPGFVLGILPFLLSLILGNSNLLWFGIIQTAAASGDWLILWLLRNVKGGMQVEDHPSRAGCYVYEP
jgi:hypothetical protein